jgi:RNA polymerase sigma-70 factor, ECF subfamily
VAIARAVSLLDEALLMRSPGPYQIEAAIASLHCQAKTAAETDWPQISALYGALWRHRPTDVVALNAAVAHAMAFSIDEGLARIDAIAARERLNEYHLLHAARADLLRRKGDFTSARGAYERALTLTQNDAERRYLQKRLGALSA